MGNRRRQQAVAGECGLSRGSALALRVAVTGVAAVGGHSLVLGALLVAIEAHEACAVQVSVCARVERHRSVPVLTTCKSINPSLNTSILQPSQPASQSVSQPVSQPASQSASQPASHQMTD